MKSIRLNIENKLILLSILIVLFWLLTVLFIFNARTLITRQNNFLIESSENRSMIAGLSLALNPPAGNGLHGDKVLVSWTILEEKAFSVEDAMIRMEKLSKGFGDPFLDERISESVRLAGNIRKQVSAAAGSGIAEIPEYENLVSNLKRLDLLTERISTFAREKTETKIVRIQKTVSIMILTGLLVIIFLLLYFSRRLSKSIRHLMMYLEKLSRGEIPGKLKAVSKDETVRIAELMNTYSDSLTKKIAYLDELSRGNFNTGFKTEPEDKLGKALLALEKKLHKSAVDEKIRATEEKKRSWNSEGLALFGEILRSEREDVSALSFNIIQNLVSHLQIEMGSIFLAGSDDNGDKFLEIIASYAYDRKKYITKRLAWGEGLPGTCALEKEKIFLTEIPADYFEISSGLGNVKPSSILLVPLKLEDEIFGIIELASVRIMENYEVQFVEALAQSIASTLAAVKNSEKTALLLKQSRQQAEELMRQDQRMKENMKELEMAQNESSRKASEITGILNAINHSSLVAEFAVNGRFSSLNDKFLLLLESPSEQILGKHHSDFAMVDKYSGEYKEFWNALKKGETISIQEKYKLFSGKEIWLQETLTPIFNNDGKVYKILDIAVDITMSVEQQESLKAQSAEIMRQTLELSSLNEAVNSSLIKCELDTDGIITDLNDNFIATSGYNRRELLGRNYRLFLKESEKVQFELIWNELIKDKTYEGVIRRTKPTGEEAWLMATFSPVRDEEGNIYKIYFLALDITEKRLKYQLLEDANREIERLKQLLSVYTQEH